MIAQLEAGKVPMIVAGSNAVGIWVDAEEQHGFLFDRVQAVDVAVKLISAAAQVTEGDTPSFVVDALYLDKPEDVVTNQNVRLVFEIAGASITATLSLDQFSDLAGHCNAISRKIDANFPRKKDD